MKYVVTVYDRSGGLNKWSGITDYEFVGSEEGISPEEEELPGVGDKVLYLISGNISAVIVQQDLES